MTKPHIAITANILSSMVGDRNKYFLLEGGNLQHQFGLYTIRYYEATRKFLVLFLESYRNKSLGTVFINLCYACLTMYLL